MKLISLKESDITTNIKKLQTWLQQHNFDVAYISSFDPYLNEYVPLTDCHRYYLTGFSGSVAEVLVPVQGKVQLFVDGRYFEQADKEVNLNCVQVMKCPANSSLFSELLKSLKSMNSHQVAFEADRTPVSHYQKLKESYQLIAFEKELATLIDFRHKPKLKALFPVAEQWRKDSIAEKMSRLQLKSKEVFYLTPLDCIAWISNYRGYHLPHLSSFYAKALVMDNKLHIFIPKGVEVDSQESFSELCFHHVDFQKSFYSELEKVLQTTDIDCLFVDFERLNTADYLFFLDAIGKEKIFHVDHGLYRFQSIKTENEIEAFKESFKKADKAIVNTIKWLKEKVAQGEQVSEFDLYQETSNKYKEHGAITQSFNTISGVGENGPIIHYSNPKRDRIIKKEELILLDSGGYFEAGFATDTTRTFLSSHNEVFEHDFSKYYTLVLKGHIRLMSAIFPEGTLGCALDIIAREALIKNGLNYQHGTGHGVGVHVHEPGVRISPVSTLPMKAGQVVSIEPGIYIPDLGGVRLESIAHVVTHPKYAGFLCFENLVYVGFEPSLINFSLLSYDEREWLAQYESECRERGNDFGVLERL